MRIQFIVPKTNRGWAYPLLKWKKDFSKTGMTIEVLDKPNYTAAKKGDVVILTSRYYRNKYKTNGEYLAKLSFDLKADIKDLGGNNTKVIFYDLSASTGSRELHIISSVDLFLKRQLLTNKDEYINKHPYRAWVKEENLFEGCGEDQVHKLHLGWNLAYQDYASWPLINPSVFKLLLFKQPTYIKSGNSRELTASYRGRMSGQVQQQRKAVVDTLKALSEQKPSSFMTGGIVKKKKFIDEMRNSRAAVSPFGYGEICYRDMEAFINGCVLIKPSMAHVDTFPNLFRDNSTYVPVKWDLSDLREKLLDVDANYNKYLPIAQKGQEVFREAYDNFEYFFAHFESIINRLYKS